MEFVLQKSSGGSLLTITGEVTLNQIEEFKQEISAALSQEESLTVDLQRITALDLAGLQVLGAAHYSAVKQNRELKVLGRDRDVYRQAVVDSGFTRHSSCSRREKGHDCLWVIDP